MHMHAQTHTTCIKIGKWVRRFLIGDTQAAIGCFSVGNPDVTNPSMIAAMYNMIDAAAANGGVLALHEYNAPYLNYSFDGNVQT